MSSLGHIPRAECQQGCDFAMLRMFRICKRPTARGSREHTTTSTPQLPSKTSQVPSNRGHKALNEVHWGSRKHAQGMTQAKLAVGSQSMGREQHIMYASMSPRDHDGYACMPVFLHAAHDTERWQSLACGQPWGSVSNQSGSARAGPVPGDWPSQGIILRQTHSKPPAL